MCPLKLYSLKKLKYLNPNPNLILFISDLHLSSEDSKLTSMFLSFLKHKAVHASALYILGDLFEMWLGDDDHNPLAYLVSTHLYNISQKNVKIYLMRGNRDIMMGETFAKRCGATLLKDPTLIDLYGTPTLLMHGDSLCTFDKKHQRYRRFTLNPIVRWLFLKAPLSLRHSLGRYLRSKSHKTQLNIHANQSYILDVNPLEVIKIFKHYGCFQMIHGHTHQPKIHYIKELMPSATRIVLGDWGKLGSVLICTPTSFELQSFS